MQNGGTRMAGKSRARLWMVLVAVFVAVVLAVPAMVGFAAAQCHLEKEKIAEVVLKEEVPLSQVLTQAKSYKVRVLGIYSTFSIGELPAFTDFQKCEETDDTSTLVKKLTTNRKEIINLLLQSCEQMLQERLCTEEGTVALQQVQYELNSAARLLSGKGIGNQEIARVKGLLVAGNATAIGMLSRRLDAEVIKTISAERSDRFQEISISPVAAPDPETWVPEEGYCVSGSYGNNMRTVCQWLRWDDKSGFGDTSTYEHDFFTNYYDGKAYLNPHDSWPGKFPIVEYWSTNLPRPYLDTRLGDPNGEKAYTIGTAKAVDLAANQWYSSTIITTPGNSSSDTGKLVAQLGHRYPSWCYSVWCSYGDHWEFIVPAWQIGLPGGKYWRY